MSHYRQTDCAEDAPCTVSYRTQRTGSLARPATTTSVHPPVTRPTTQQRYPCPAERQGGSRIQPPSQYGQYLTVPGQHPRAQVQQRAQPQVRTRLQERPHQLPQQQAIRSMTQQRSLLQRPPQQVVNQARLMPQSGRVKPVVLGTKSATRLRQPPRATAQACPCGESLPKHRSK